MKRGNVEFRLTDNFMNRYKRKKVDFGPLGYFIHKRTYARDLGNNKTEEWWQTIQRVVEGCFLIQKRHCVDWMLPWHERRAQASAQTMYDLIFNMKFLPPGRGLWSMGTDFVFDRGSACLQNCGFTSTADINQDFSAPFVWLMDMSLVGVGVGFDNDGAAKGVHLKRTRDDPSAHVIEDSREGWVAAFKRVLDAFSGQDTLPTHFDYSQIRPAGSPILGAGGIAPGHDPLEKLIDRTYRLCMDYLGADKPVDSTFITDIMNFAGAAVVAGGIRRTAEIAFGSPDDEEFLNLKSQANISNPDLARWASNNSVIAYKGMDYSEVAERAIVNGEPGLFWLENARAFGRMKEGKNWHDKRVKGCNPCVTGDTRVLTTHGYAKIKELSDRNNVETVWNGQEWSVVKPTVTGYNQPIVEVQLSDGTSLKCTEYHDWCIVEGDRHNSSKKVRAIDLQPGMCLEKFEMPVMSCGKRYDNMYCQGLYTGDGQGNGGRRGVLVYDHSKELLPVLEAKGCTIGEYSSKYKRTWAGMGRLALESKYFVPLEGDLRSRLEWFAGLLDSDGTVLTNPNSKMIQISNTNLEFLLETRLMLTTCGVQAKVTLNREARTGVEMPGGTYDCKAQYRLLINSSDTYKLCSLGLKSYHHNLPTQEPQRDARRYVTVTKVKAVGNAPVVYCFTDPKNGTGTFEGIVTGQCGEQSLEDRELCNLVETFPSRHDTKEEYLTTLKYAYLYAKTVTLLSTHDPRTNAVLFRNRRIGLSQSGIAEQINKIGFREHLQWCEEGYQRIKHWDETYSDWFCVPRSRKMTSVKPSGTVSLLPGVPPGIHYPHSEYYVRRVQVSTNSSLVKIMKKAGYKVEKCVYADDTMVIEFPVHENYFSRSKDEVSMWEQFELAAAMQRKWADNQVSITITIRPQEECDLAHALSMYENRLKAVSFLPLRGDEVYKQAPYEKITKAAYKRMVAKIKPVRYDITEAEDRIVTQGCDGDSCEILPVLEKS